jgi:hypothetical protein
MNLTIKTTRSICKEKAFKERNKAASVPVLADPGNKWMAMISKINKKKTVTLVT